MIIYPNPDFARSAPQAQGIAPRAIGDMLRDIKQTGADIHSMLIMRHGHLVFEHYYPHYEPSTQHAMYSCSKTFTSMLIGIAQDRGLLSVTDRVVSFFPDKVPENPSENLKAMTIADLLMMGSGNAKDTFPAMMAVRNDPDADFVRVFLNQPVEYKPGTHFVYNTGATYMLSAILTKVTGLPAIDLANEWLFEPMEITGAWWESCPRGVSLGGTGLHITPRDMLKMGILLSAGGMWKDQRLVSQAYVDAATTKHIENRSGDPNQDKNWASGYCYQIWRCAFGAFRADGMGGQFILCKPDQDLICVFTSALGEEIPIGYPLDLVEKYLLPALSDGPIDGAEEELQALYALSDELSHPRAGSAPEELPIPDGTALTVEPNDLDLTGLVIGRDAVRVSVHGQDLNVPCGWGAPVLATEPQYDPYTRGGDALISGETAVDGDVLRIWLRFLGRPLTMRFDLAPAPEGYEVSVHSTLMPTVCLKARPC
ncbi:MAG: beta-lactamase family protein [Clostridia bacterium]|nr:beta-lactamase family protein [Clostridia bacterium]